MGPKHWCSSGLWLTFVFWTPASSTAELTQEIAQCAATADGMERLRCYDRLAERSRSFSRRGNGLPELERVLESSVSPEENDVTDKQVSSDADRPRKGYWLGIQPYRRNYILPVTYNDRVNNEILDGTGSGYEVENVEMKFQLSFELPVWEGILDQDLDIYFAYTQLSFFQAYNTQYSSPFRDTVYEPEVGLNWQPGLEFLGWRLKSARVALNHQSNGRTEPLSRSWNRLIGQLEVERGNLSLGLRLWDRFQEDSENDDNPDITDFLGYGELVAVYKSGPHGFGLMLRNPQDHAAVQIGWSRRLSERVRFYVQYYNGYGESLIDYDNQVNRLGIGFLLNEWP